MMSKTPDPLEEALGTVTTGPAGLVGGGTDGGFGDATGELVGVVTVGASITMSLALGAVIEVICDN